jgi:protein DGCR14
MAGSLSTQLVKRAAQDVSLMPPPPFKRIKRPPKVLDEDDYTSALSNIIARDYFPGLLESQAQHEYLAALESGNDAWIVEAGQKMRDAAAGKDKGSRRSARNTRFDATPLRAGDTPVGFTGSETPMSVADSTHSSQPEDKKLDTSNLTLSAFQAKYTSEDNESFNALLDKQNLIRRQKHAYMWTPDQRIYSTRLIEHRAREQHLLQQSADEANGKALIPMSVGATSSRPAKPDAWKTNKPDNAFMFLASSIDEDGLPTTMEVNQANSKAGARETVHANTRFPPLQYIDDPGPLPPSPSLNTDIIARRKILRVGSVATTTETEFSGAETPRVNGYAFVDEDEPETITQVQQEPSYRDLLAGQVGDAAPNPFKLSDTRKREDLHHRMVEKQARRKREKDREIVRTPLGIADKGAGGKTPMGNMTPAGRKLMGKLGRTPLRGVVAEDGKEKMVDWTPGRTSRRGKVAR